MPAASQLAASPSIITERPERASPSPSASPGAIRVVLAREGPLRVTIRFLEPLDPLACPDRKVIGMQADGSGMYTVQGLWTQAREGLNVVTIVFANRIYQILRGEFDGVGAGEPGKRAQDMLKIDRPTLDFVALAKGMGVPAVAVASADEFNKALANAVAEPGPRLIEVQM